MTRKQKFAYRIKSGRGAEVIRIEPKSGRVLSNGHVSQSAISRLTGLLRKSNNDVDRVEPRSHR